MKRFLITLLVCSLAIGTLFAGSESETTEEDDQFVFGAIYMTMNNPFFGALNKNEMLITPIEDVIKLGESGINFPAFLRLMIEKGLDRISC